MLEGGDGGDHERGFDALDRDVLTCQVADVSSADDVRPRVIIGRCGEHWRDECPLGGREGGGTADDVQDVVV